MMRAQTITLKRFWGGAGTGVGDSTHEHARFSLAQLLTPHLDPAKGDDTSTAVAKGKRRGFGQQPRMCEALRGADVKTPGRSPLA